MKEKLKEFFKNPKQYMTKKMAIICSGVLAVLVITCAVTITLAYRNNKNNLVVEDTSEDQTQQETTAEETMEETSEEDTEESVVSEDELEDYLENVINDEDEAPLPVYDASGYRYVAPYDGVARSVSCWGDSMTYGTNVSASEAYPSVLEDLIGLTVYNLGVPGEDSVQIATRQGAYGMYTDRDITISPDYTTEVCFISSYTGQPIYFYTDASGYSDRSRPANDLGDIVLIGDTVAYGYRAGDATIHVQLCTQDLQLASVLTRVVSTKCSALNTMYLSYVEETQAALASEEIAYYESQSGSEEETTTATVSEKTASSTEQTTTQAQTQKTTEAETGTTTETTTAATEPDSTQAQPADAEVSNTIFIPAGTTVKTRASIERSGDILILEIGSNGGWQSNYQELINQYNAMIDSSGCQYYIIVGDTDDPGTSYGDTQQDSPYDSTGNYIGIGNTAWESTLQQVYGDHFINMRVELIKHGLEYTEMEPTKEDLLNYKYGFISTRLRSDWTHLNGPGYYAKARLIYEKGVSLGYWG